MPKPQVKKGLGKGLGALIPGLMDDESQISLTPSSPPGTSDASGENVLEVKLIDIEPNREQPRKHFDPEKLQALTESIKTHGIIQPLIVTPTPNGTYRIVAGERRWRAARNADIKTAPCIVKDYTEREIMELALIENLQREDLNPIEEAEGYKQLMLQFGLTQEDISLRVSKSRSAIANALRLNNLPLEIKDMLVENRLSSGHARALLGTNDQNAQLSIARRIIDESLNVRQVEALVSAISTNKPTKPQSKVDKAIVRYYMDMENLLSSRLGTKVKIHSGKNKGKIEIEYYTREDFDRLLEHFNYNNY